MALTYMYICESRPAVNSKDQSKNREGGEFNCNVIIMLRIQCRKCKAHLRKSHKPIKIFLMLVPDLGLVRLYYKNSLR